MDNRTDDPQIHSDTDLIDRWFRSQRAGTAGSGVFLWANVEQTFCIGSTSAKQVCRRFGFDPDMKVRRG